MKHKTLWLLIAIITMGLASATYITSSYINVDTINSDTNNLITIDDNLNITKTTYFGNESFQAIVPYSSISLGEGAGYFTNGSDNWAKLGTWNFGLEVNGDAYFDDDIEVDGSISSQNDISANDQLSGGSVTAFIGNIGSFYTDTWDNNFTAPVTIFDDLNVTGNVTAENVFLPQYIFSHTNQTIPVKDANVWTNITFDQENAEIMQGISHTHNSVNNQTFTVMEGGIYNVDYDLDLEDTSVGASDINVAGRLILIDGTEVEGSVFETDIVKQGVEAELSHNFLVECTTGEQLIFQFVASDADVEISTHGTYGEHTDSATILITKISN